MEEHVAHVYVGGPTEESNTRKFLTNLSFKNVRQINTVKFTCLLNNKEDNSKEVTKEEFLEAISKYLDLSDEEQLELLKKCCTFVNYEETLNCLKFELPTKKDYFKDVKEELETDRDIQNLEKRLKYCKNHLEKQQITRELQSLKSWNSKKRGGKPHTKKKNR